MLPAGVAAGHPATVATGVEILEAGGSAIDAAVAACLASCVAETLMTGLLGGGHALVLRPGGTAADVECLDFFVAVPGLGARPREAELLRLEVPFGTELVHYAVGIASCAVPGVPAGLDALWQAGGRLQWPRLVEPALRLARRGVALPPAHAACLAMLAPVMTMREGARIYAPRGALLQANERLEQPGLVAALELLAGEGAASVYRGTLAEALLALMEERGGLVTAADLARYEPLAAAHSVVDFCGAELVSRASPFSPLPVLGGLPELRDASPGERAVALARSLRAPDAAGHTTNITTVDREGTVCVLTTSLGLGSGDWVPGYDLHLNSMLGETDLLIGPLTPGSRMQSMMAPTLAVGSDGPVLAAGAAGGTRLRSALVQVIAGILDEGLDPAQAVARPRLHPVGDLVNVEPGFEPDALAALEEVGLEVRAWTSLHHYFGGVSAIAGGGAAGDPRRDGGARLPR